MKTHFSFLAALTLTVVSLPLNIENALTQTATGGGALLAFVLLVLWAYAATAVRRTRRLSIIVACVVFVFTVLSIVGAAFPRDPATSLGAPLFILLCSCPMLGLGVFAADVVTLCILTGFAGLFIILLSLLGPRLEVYHVEMELDLLRAQKDKEDEIRQELLLQRM